ncbi:MAG: tryptophan synthase subunit alpha [Proteobacteria bacterium]|nr:tryptophan synthase subunit alpha [Pseudomonadota bacterium]
MNRLDELFAQERTLLVTYLCAGDPTPEASPALFQACIDGGADVLEIGVPFSDPGADGPAIQQASERALAAGTTLDRALDIAGSVDGGVAKVLFGYLNPFLAYGYERLAAKCAEVGIHGVLCVDCPVEEEPEFRDALALHGIHPILLIAPTTPDDRIVGLAPSAGGFVYYVSMTGVTGAALDANEALVERIRRVRDLSGQPVAVGFGVRTPDDARTLGAVADGVVVGSALVRVVAEHGADAVVPLRRDVAALKAALA